MLAPQAILDGLESVLSVYFSNVRHNTRAAFLLCDELVEVICKERALQASHRETFAGFHDCLCKPAVGLDPKAVTLGQRVADNHKTRNLMQHGSAAVTVDDLHCADAIVYAVDVIEHCFPGTGASLSSSMQVLLRVARLHSTAGDKNQRVAFETRMREYAWNRHGERATTRKRPVSVGERPNWGLVLVPNHDAVRTILDEVGAP